jgi:MYXO-CTERM domain-containing protein
MLGFVGSALGQTSNIIIVGDGTGAPGDTGVSVTVSMDNTDPIAGLQFDLAPPPGVTLVSGIADAARAPGWHVNTGPTNPPTILMFSIPIVEIAPGTGVIAELFFDVDPSAVPAVWNFSVSALVLSDIGNTQVPGSAIAGQFEILGTGDDDDSAGDDDDSAGDDDDSADDDDDSAGDDDDSAGDDDDSVGDDDDDSVGDDDDSAGEGSAPDCSCESASHRPSPGAWALLPMFAVLGRRRRR